MYVFELVQPGCWLEGLDEEPKRDVEALLRLLADCVQDAAIALSLFDSCQQDLLQSHEIRREFWDADRERERRIQADLEGQLPTDLDFQARMRASDAIRERARQEAKRQKWAEGHLPESYTHRLPFLHAKSFVYALDTLQKSLELLARTRSVPVDVAAVMAQFRDAFPDLVHVRDSSHHAEDRVQGKRRGSRIEPKPMMTSAVHAPGGGVLVVDMLNGRRYGGTLGDGSYGEVDVSPESLVLAGECVQRALDAFTWSGPVLHMPR